MQNGDIVIEAQDWIDYILRKELVVRTRDEMLEVGVSHSPKVAAMAAIVSRHLGEAPDEILRPNKDLLQDGAAGHIYVLIRHMRTTWELENGEEVSVSRYNKPPAQREEYLDAGGDGNGEPPDVVTYDIAAEEPDDDDGEPLDRRYAEVGSDQYYDNAVVYLHRIVPGHIRNRLVEIATCGGDVRSNADVLIDKIEDMVTALT